MHPHIEADNVDQAEAGALGQPDQRPRQRVHFLHRVIALFGEQPHFRPEEAADAIADKVGRILARHHAFAEVQIAERRHPIEDFTARLRPRDHLRQVQVARRIEEVRAQKMLPELAIEALGDPRQRNPAGIRRDNRPRRAQRRHAAPQRPFDLEILRHGFDDPLASPHAAQIVLEIPRRDQRSRGVGEKRHGPLLRRAFDSRQRRRIPLGLVRQHDIQQVHREPRIGKMGRDPRPHGPRPQNRNTA